jgi:hypothetical protein
MQSFLIKYLVVTGIGAALVLAMPWLVIIGFFLLILPGIVLALMPTAFLYGVLFSVIWFPLHHWLGEWPASVLAGLVTFGVFYAIPIEGNRVTYERFEQQMAGDVTPSVPIILKGHLRLDSWSRYNLEHSRSSGRPWAPNADYYSKSKQCSEVCAGLLLMDGVESVTVVNSNSPVDGSPPTTRAVTFSRIPRAQCSESIVPNHNFNQFGSVPPKFSDLLKLRLASGDCILGSAPRATHDLRLVASDETVPLPDRPSQRDRWMSKIGPRSVHSSRLEIFDGKGKLLLRQTAVTAKKIFQPMAYVPDGGMENFRFQWASSLFKKGGHWATDRMALLLKNTNLRFDVDEMELARATEGKLRAVMDDTALPATDPAFELVPIYFNNLDPKRITKAEAELGVLLVGDPRTRQFGQIYKLGASPAVDGLALRNAVAERWLAAELPADGGLKQLGSALKGLPKGSFATLIPKEDALLADAEKRKIAGSLIARLSDQGLSGAPRLATLLEELVAARDSLSNGRGGGSDHSDAIGGAVTALCVIGPAGSDVLYRVDALARFGTIKERRFGTGRDWDLLLVRLGKPPEQINKPKNMSGTVENYRRNLRARAERVERTGRC